MASTKHDEDDVELNDIKAEDKIGASDESDGEPVDEDMEVSPESMGADMWLVKVGIISFGPVSIGGISLHYGSLKSDSTLAQFDDSRSQSLSWRSGCKSSSLESI